MQQLQNKVALITGGSKGIGLGIAAAMLTEGMKVAITARGQSDLDKAAKQLSEDFPENVLALQSNAKSYEDQEAAVKAVVDKWGQLDVLVANAGVGHFAPIDKMSIEHWNNTIDTNLTGVFYSVKSCIPALKASQGFIFTIASLAGTNFFEQGAAYNASKFGLVGFTQAAMLDLRKHDIRMSTIMPGSVATEFNNHVPNDKDAWKIQPEDIGQMVVDVLKINPRTLPSKIEVRPSFPHKKPK